MTRSFTKWVLLANLISWPITYFVMKLWLQNFAFRTGMGLEVFVLSGALAFGIALLTVSFLAVRAAAANPVDSLRYE